jgi:hypothetical protein
VIPFDGNLKRELESLLSDAKKKKKEQKQGGPKTGILKIENKKKTNKKLKYELHVGL